jgi:hypothetical protein
VHKTQAEVTSATSVISNIWPPNLNHKFITFSYKVLHSTVKTHKKKIIINYLPLSILINWYALGYNKHSLGYNGAKKNPWSFVAFCKNKKLEYHKRHEF